MANPITRRHWCVAAGLILVACSRPQTLPVFGTVPPFRLITSTGQEFDSKILTGKPWLASFFFASCNGPCPRLNTTIHDLQEQTYRFKDLHIVSLTVDPEHDTPEVLANYAKRYKADPDRWHFLTGPRRTISRLSRETFLTGELDFANTHSTRIMLIDRKRQIRGHFQTETKEEIAALLAAIESVEKESK